MWTLDIPIVCSDYNDTQAALAVYALVTQHGVSIEVRTNSRLLVLPRRNNMNFAS